MSLDSQIQSMVTQGAALGDVEGGLTFLIGLALVDEQGQQLLIMEQWASGTGGAHVFRWDQVEQKSNQIVFSTGGRVAFGIAPYGSYS